MSFEMQFDRLARHNAWKGRGGVMPGISTEHIDAFDRVWPQVGAWSDANARLFPHRAFDIGLTSAGVAYDRLRYITRRDREACGDGRWVRAPDAWSGHATTVTVHMDGCSDDTAYPLKKGVYRWESRR